MNIVQAAESLTMYKGEKFEYSLIGGTISSVTSSKKTVVKTAKVKGRNAYTLDAKKTGSTTSRPAFDHYKVETQAYTSERKK